MEWNEISNSEFARSAFSQDNYIRVIWSGFFGDGVRSRKCIIHSIEDWRSVIENAFLPRYKDGRCWEDPIARNFTLLEYSLDVHPDVKSKANERLSRQANEINLTSVYHPTLDKRLIVDGVHRAIGLQLKINKNEQIPEVRLMECYGTNVAQMFEADFGHLIE